MRIKFCGAARCVTGSCHMIEFGGKKVLVDCGMRQGADTKTELGEGDFPFNPTEIEAVLLTHAHIDHSGLIPLLVRRGFAGKIIATRATAELSGIMLPDSGHIQEQEAEYTNRKNLRAGRAQVEPLYTAEDAVKSLTAFRPVSYGDVVEVAPGMRARFTDVGHLLGSAAIEVWVSEDDKTRKIVFSGDIGRDNRPILQDPQPIGGADYVVMEGTYGDRDHSISMENDKEAELAALLREGIARGGNIVIPSFAVGRTQELLYYIKRLMAANAVPGLDKVPVYIDSPLGISATKVYERCAEEYYDDEAKAMAKEGSPFDFPNLRVAQTSDESRMINFATGCNIIISSSGMCDAGRIRHHLKHNLYRKDSTVIFAGYQAEGTLGRMLTDGARRVKLFGEEIQVNAAIKQAEGFSGHAGQSELVAWLKAIGQKPECVFLVHGEEETLSVFADKLSGEGFSVVRPRLLDEYELSAQAEQTEHVAPALTKTAPQARDTFAPRELAELAKRFRLNGAVAVRKGEMPIYEAAYGMADAEGRTLNTLHTRFAVGEITRIYTAALIVKLAKEKKLSLSDTLDRFVPEYVHASKLSISDMLYGKLDAPDYIEYSLAFRTEEEIRANGMTDGQADIYRWEKLNARITDSEVIALINGMNREPLAGEGRRSSFRLLGMAAERAGGKPLAKLMEEKLFGPLGLEETVLGATPDALPYAAAAGKPVRIAVPQNAGGETGIVTSAQDMIKWLQALMDGKVVAKTAARRFFKHYAGWYVAFSGFSNAQTMVALSEKYGVAALAFSNMPETAPEGEYEPVTGAITFSRKIRSELDETYTECRETKLCPVDGSNFIETLRLGVSREQEEFVAPNAVSLAEALTKPHFARPYVVTEGGTPVGFVMLYADRKSGEYEVWRFMIDARYQGRGFGRAALALAIEECKRLGAKKVELSVSLDNYRAKRLYEAAGFKYSGHVAEGEEYMTLSL